MTKEYPSRAFSTSEIPYKAARFINWSLVADVQDAGLCEGADQGVLMCLARHADEKGVCYPGQATIARHAGTGVRNVRKILAKLIAMKLIERGKRSDKGTVCFRLNTQRIKQEASLYRISQHQGDAPLELTFESDEDGVPVQSKWNPSSTTTGTTVPHQPEPQFHHHRNPSSASTGTPVPSDRTHSSASTGTPVPSGRTHSSYKHNNEEYKEENSEHRVDDEFSLFWRNFPKPRNSKKSRELFLDAIEGGVDPAYIVSAAKAYAVEVKGRELQHIEVVREN